MRTVTFGRVAFGVVFQTTDSFEPSKVEPSAHAFESIRSELKATAKKANKTNGSRPRKLKNSKFLKRPAKRDTVAPQSARHRSPRAQVEHPTSTFQYQTEDQPRRATYSPRRKTLGLSFQKRPSSSDVPWHVDHFSVRIPSVGIEEIFLLIVGGFIGGLIDSIVGGGGLITVPVFLMILGPQASAVGTNKVAAVAAQLAALTVYFRSGHIDFNRAWKFLIVTSIGAVFGALAAPLLPTSFFKWFLVFVVPGVLLLVFTRGLWTRPVGSAKYPRLAMVGTFVAGVYDGIAGPGGGTLMFLSLFLLGGIPATMSMGTAKLANLGSASFSLTTYALQGNVQWALGAVMGVPIALGAWLGARYSAKRSQEDEARKLARTALVAVSLLLLIRWITLIR